MKNFLLIALVVGMCDSCRGQDSDRFRSFGKNEGRDATPEYSSSELNAGDTLPEFNLQEPRVKL